MNSSATSLDQLREHLELERPTVHASLLASDFDQMDPVLFRDRAADFLDDHSSRLRANVDALIDLPGRWHPSGYAVFTVGHHESFGTLRFHVWPAGLRRAEPRPPGLRDIHDHVLHISSLVVAGTYADSFYEVTDHDADPHAPGALHVYSPPPSLSGSQGLEPTGAVVTANETERRRAAVGEVHFIPEGPFHVPTIAGGVTCATLSFSSPAVRGGGPRILFASNVGPVRGVKTAISAQEREKIKRLVGRGA